MTIPLVDLGQWFDGDETQRAALARQVDDHLQCMGFLVVVNHGIEPTLLDTCREQARSFFHQPEAIKANVEVGDGPYRGWVGGGRESHAATYGIDTPPDLKETYAYGPVDVRDPALRETQPRWFAENVWPASLPAMQNAAEAWWRSARELADVLLDVFGAALGLPAGQLVEAADRTSASGALNWYWARSRQSPEPGQFRIGPHTDFGTLTILDREPGIGGLQVRDGDGVWQDAPVVDGGLIVNLGDMMHRWTNGRWCSNEHRVLPPPADAPTEELVSLIFFHSPSFDTLLDPLPTCVSAEQPARFEPVLAGDYLGAKLDELAVS